MTSIGVASVLILTVVAVVFVRDYQLRNSTSPCGDKEGSRPRIDLRDFETDYTVHSVSFEAEIVGKAKFSGKIDPAEMQKLSEATQTGMEFRKAIVAGYNSCGVTRATYQLSIVRFQALDNLAQELNRILEKPVLTDQDHTSLVMLIDEYVKRSRDLGESSK